MHVKILQFVKWTNKVKLYMWIFYISYFNYWLCITSAVGDDGHETNHCLSWQTCWTVYRYMPKYTHIHTTYSTVITHSNLWAWISTQFKIYSVANRLDIKFKILFLTFVLGVQISSWVHEFVRWHNYCLIPPFRIYKYALESCH